MVRTLFLALSLAAAPCAQSALAFTALTAPVVEVPFDTSAGHIAVAVKVNGHGPFRFNLDTGAGLQACIDEELVETLGLRKVGSALNGDGAGKTTRRGLHRIDALRVGGATFRGVTALASDYRWIDRRRDRRVYGLLGFKLFAEVMLSIDFPRRQLSLWKGQLDADASPHVVRYRSKMDVPTIELSFGDLSARAIIDTGASRGVTLPHGLMDDAPVRGLRESGTSQTVSGVYPVLQGRLREPLSFAGHERHDLTAHFMRGFDQALLGVPLLRRYVVTFDQHNERVEIVARKTRRKWL